MRLSEIYLFAPCSLIMKAVDNTRSPHNWTQSQSTSLFVKWFINLSPCLYPTCMDLSISIYIYLLSICLHLIMWAVAKEEPPWYDTGGVSICFWIFIRDKASAYLARAISGYRLKMFIVKVAKCPNQRVCYSFSSECVSSGVNNMKCVLKAQPW